MSQVAAERTLRTARCLLAAAGCLMALCGQAAADVAVTERDALTLGVRDDAFPFSYRSADGRHIGYSVELCQRVAEALARQRGRALQTRYLTVTARNRFAHLLAGNIDLECGATTNTYGRAGLGLAFSLTFFISDVAVLGAQGERGLKTVADLARLQATDAPVITTAGTTAVAYLPQLRHRLGAQFAIAHAADHGEAMQMLAEGRASAFVMDRVLLAARLAAADGGNGAAWQLLQGTVADDAVEHYALVMRDTAADQPLKQRVDDTLLKMMQSGEMEALYKRWFIDPIEAPGGNRSARKQALGIELAPALRQMFRQPSDRPFEPAARAQR